MENAGVQLPRYKCHKEVNAAKITDIQPYGTDGSRTLLMDCAGLAASSDMTAEWVIKHKPQIGGYLVIYKDGYHSFSPAEAFEDGYTKM